MIHFLKKIKNVVRLQLLPNQLEKELKDYFSRKKENTLKGDELVVVSATQDPYYFALFGTISIALANSHAYRFEQFLYSSLSVGESSSPLKFIVSRVLNFLSKCKWKNLHSSFCDGIAYQSTGLKSPVTDIADLCKAYKIWRGISAKNTLTSLSIEGILVGDLVNDSYLRFKPSPTVELNNFYLFIVLFQACRDIRQAKNYFSKKKPKIFLASYSTYIQHGIAVRVALSYGVKVFSFGNYQEFAKQLSIKDWFHTKNAKNYAHEFTLLPNAQEKLELSERALGSRISGAIDNATSYMKQSAYKHTDEPIPDVSDAVIVFLHDFYDSPHVYDGMLFPDFWEWICFTIETLRENNIKFFLKPHPNQISLSDTAIKQLLKKYPALNLLTSKVTNKQLVDGGILCGVTVYGTVAHELSFMGVPSIGCACHPHISFDFCKTAKTKTEYATLLRNSSNLDNDHQTLKTQSQIFYYMHNLNYTAQQQMLIKSNSELRSIINDKMADNRLLCQVLEKLEGNININLFLDN
jgi:hypothetical protein